MKRYRNISIICFLIAFILSLFIGCSIPLYRVEITPTAPLVWSDYQAWGYQKDLQNPSRAITLPKCQGRAAREYYTLKEKGYDACVLMGIKAGEGHVEASILKNGNPIDLKGMRVTHVMNQEKLWRIQAQGSLLTWDDLQHDQWLRYGR